MVMSMSNLCAYEVCGKEFERKTHNQKYCDAECCRKATNERIMERYYEKRDARSGAVSRKCKKCETNLSRYNETEYCSPCSSLKKPHRDRLLRSLNL